MAEECLAGHRADDPPTGPSSPFARLVEFGGKIVYLGAPLGCSTFLHYLEDHLDMPYLTGALSYLEDEGGEIRVVYTPKHLAGDRDFYRDDRGHTKVFRGVFIPIL